ncbi:ATP-binding protein [Lentibacter sp. XHP0401]|uniref:ATP-binding protein n=1 Tax=Lentibacter sp. XHP0401 TaxID=2984334 RepID=UPI0021E9346B|nr:ATP-binding protein [Lentibacter sp. XHP0401]MCV2893653.1 ATP-binding protein [Lentibacter sp. XHP0401]
MDPKTLTTDRPIAFKKNIAGYEKDKIWVRDGNEVVQAQPRHFASLFISGDNDGVEGLIPPSNAQIKRFIGRVEAMAELFDWIYNSDEPRTYLYGKGGSGKTTIAREFAKLVKSAGKGLQIECADPVDIVLFLSAKEKELSSPNAEVVDLSDPDFHDELSLLSQIVKLSGGEVDIGDAEVAELKDYRRTVQEYLDHFSYLIVLDDVDTLTTKGIDPGADFLFRALSRAKKRSKVLYTIRNAPSQSIHNSIEVPGLFGKDYLDFVQECVEKFRAPEPNVEFRDNRLPHLSERRPLVIESIIALSRTAGGYEGADRLFTQNVGDDIRNYVFLREWDALSNGLERPLLAALSDLNRPTSFQDLKVVLQAGDSSIRDAISAVREMFLVVDDAGQNTFYSLAGLTRSFVNSKKENLKLYPAVKERVRAFKRTAKIASPEVARIVATVRKYVPLRLSSHSSENLKLAFDLVRDSTLKLAVTEDPVFRALKGYVEALQTRVELHEVRENFQYSLQMKHEPEFEELTAWYNAEKSSNIVGEHLFQIMDAVTAGRRYSEDQKIGMISRKATTAYHIAQQKFDGAPDEAQSLMRLSVLLHAQAFKQNILNGSPMADISERYCRNTADQYFRIISSYGPWEPFGEMLLLQDETEGYLDPVADAILIYIERASRQLYSKSEKSRVKNKIRDFISAKFPKEKWLDTTLPPIIEEKLRSFSAGLQ